MSERGPQYEVPLPAQMTGLPRDHRGFVVPYFVQWFDGERACAAGQGVPDFRVMNRGLWHRCVKFRVCWLCGRGLGKREAFVIGPMCVITRTTSEPGSHRACAEYAVRVCPFLSRPRMVRNEVGLPSSKVAPAGLHVAHNPGLMALWIAPSAKPFRDRDGGLLLQVQEPYEVQWWKEARPATRAEVAAAWAKALPTLEAQTARDADPADSMRVLRACLDRARQYLPVE